MFIIIMIMIYYNINSKISNSSNKQFSYFKQLFIPYKKNI